MSVTPPAGSRAWRARKDRLERQRRTWSLVTQVELIIVLTGLFWLVLVGQGQARLADRRNADAISRGNATNDLILAQSNRIVICVETPAHCPGYVPVVVTQTVTATVSVPSPVPGPVVVVPGPARTVPAPAQPKAVPAAPAASANPPPPRKGKK